VTGFGGLWERKTIEKEIKNFSSTAVYKTAMMPEERNMT
jgi:hypothetical protein